MQSKIDLLDVVALTENLPERNLYREHVTFEGNQKVNAFLSPPRPRNE